MPDGVVWKEMRVLTEDMKKLVCGTMLCFAATVNKDGSQTSPRKAPLECMMIHTYYLLTSHRRKR